MKHTLLPITQIKFDPENPRLGDILTKFESVNDDRVAFHLKTAGGDSETIKSGYAKLEESIMGSKGIIDPIKVIADDNDNGYVCIDGNTRLSIYKKFALENPDSGLWNTIPSIVCDKNNTDLIDTIRIAAHMVGARDWGAYEKARYLHQLRYERNKSMNDIIAIAGGSSKEIQQSIDAYQDMNQHYRDRVAGQDFRADRYSGFVELQNPKVKEAIYKNNFSLNDFGDWIGQAKIKALRKVRVLPKILEDEEARKIFLADGFDTITAAEKNLEQRNPILIPGQSAKLKSASILNLAAALKDRLEKIDWQKREALINPTNESEQTEAQILSDLKRLISSMLEV